MKWLLLPLMLLYGLGIALRNLLYRTGILKSASFNLPIICIGNLSVGGSGKTPMTEYLIGLLKEDHTVGVISRGYKRHTKGFRLAGPSDDATTLGDEPAIYHSKHAGIYVAVGEDRATAISELLAHQSSISTILLDDAFQHRSVCAGLNILLTDYYRPFWKDHLLPVGRLREFRTGRKRADILVITKCPHDMTAAEMSSVQKATSFPAEKTFFASINYPPAYPIFKDIPAQDDWSNILLVTGIAHSEPLVHHLKKITSNVRTMEFKDHHYYTFADLKKIKNALSDMPDNTILLTTEKDAIRLNAHQQSIISLDLPFFIQPMKMVILERAGDFEKMINKFIESYRLNG